MLHVINNSPSSEFIQKLTLLVTQLSSDFDNPSNSIVACFPKPSWGPEPKLDPPVAMCQVISAVFCCVIFAIAPVIDYTGAGATPGRSYGTTAGLAHSSNYILALVSSCY